MIRFFVRLSFLALIILLSGWGAVGHSKISESASLSFNQQMQEFQAWVGFLRDHASDADYRKDTDPSEGPKHYIDIDNYAEFVSTGRIPQTLDSAVSLHGYSFVEENGFLPWATQAAFDSLRNCMQRRDFAKAQIFAADLGHYVADGHMPLHVTRNYNGQFTGNTGIHSRFESTMINGNISQIQYLGSDATEIPDVQQYIFDYLYVNNTFCDSILAADNYAKSLSSNYSSSTYRDALWQKSIGFTIPLFERASHALASLIYTAWIQAGSPSLNSSSVVEAIPAANAELSQNSPNPFTGSTKISYSLNEESRLLIQVRDIDGATMETLVNDTVASGSYSFEWAPKGLSAGVYFLVLNTGKTILLKKMIIAAN